MSFEYFYGGQSENFSFYRIPRILITGEKYRGLSTDAKLLYGLMLDRMGLSAKNGWYDDYDRVYIYYTVDEIMEDLCCGHNKAIRLLAELDTKGIGLIERKKQGQGKPTMIYVKQFVETVPPAPRGVPASSRCPKTGSAEAPKEEVQTSQKETSRLPETGGADFPKEEARPISAAPVRICKRPSPAWTPASPRPETMTGSVCCTTSSVPAMSSISTMTTTALCERAKTSGISFARTASASSAITLSLGISSGVSCFFAPMRPS